MEKGARVLSRKEHRDKVLCETRQRFKKLVQVNVVTIEKSFEKLNHNVNDSFFSENEKVTFYQFLDDN